MTKYKRRCYNSKFFIFDNYQFRCQKPSGHKGKHKEVIVREWD